MPLAGAQSKPLRVVYEDANFIAGTVENVVLVVWEHDTQRAAVKQVRELVHRMAAQFPKGIGLIQVVGEEHPSLRSDARAELNLMLRSGANAILCSSVVFEGSGFRAAAVRAAVAGLVMLSRIPFPHQVFAKIDAAVEWEIAHLRNVTPQLGRYDLIDGLAGLRTRLRNSAISRTA